LKEIKKESAPARALQYEKAIHTMPYKKNPRERHGAELLFLQTETAPKSQKAHLLI
jgi:hypothetical protein